MTLPLFHVAPDVLVGVSAGDRVVLDGPEGRHAAQVRRIQVGERVLVADGHGVSAECVVAGVDGSALTLEVESVSVEDEPSPRFVLVQALAKGGRDEDAIEAATEVGVDEVVPWQAGRSIVQWRGPKVDKGHRKWVDTVTAAAKQSRRGRTPVVAPVVTTTDLADRVGRASAAYVLHEEATVPLTLTALPEAGDVLVVVGPEGGIGPDEMEVLMAAGARPVRLGTTVLRSSTAGPAALAVLSARTRWR